MNRDPRYRARLNQISSTLETANLNTQASLWTFKESYLTPCLASVSSCLEGACYPCIGARRERARARQRRSAATARGRPEFVFDFYNDEWDTEDEEAGERSGLLRGWGTDELDRLLAGSGTGVAGGEDMSGRQPKRKAGMSYGATTTGGRRRQSTLLAGQGSDPTILPGSSMFGFLERLPWRIGGRGVRYKPSAADLQENLGGERRVYGAGRKKPGIDQEMGNEEETSALLDDEDDDNTPHQHKQHKKTDRTHRRNRSGTESSRSTQNSLSSRGDLFPSEDEAADAVPLDDSFALSFARRSSDGEHDSHTEPEFGAPTSQSKSSKESKGSNNKSPSASSRRRSKSSKSSRKDHVALHSQKPPIETAQSHTSRSPAHSEMVHSPLTPTPLTPSGSGEQVRSAWSIYSDAENEADESAVVSPVVERMEIGSADEALVARVQELGNSQGRDPVEEWERKEIQGKGSDAYDEESASKS